MATKRQFNLENVVNEAKETIDTAKETAKTEKQRKIADRENKGAGAATGMKKNLRNAFVSDETLFRLSVVKKQLNSDRSEGSGHVSLAVLMGQMIEEYLDNNYPETKNLYQKIYGK